MKKSLISIILALSLVISLMLPATAATGPTPSQILPPMQSSMMPYDYFSMASEKGVSVSEGEAAYYYFEANRGIRSRVLSVNADQVTYPAGYENQMPPVGSRRVSVVILVPREYNKIYRFMQIRIGDETAIVSPTYDRSGNPHWDALYIDIQSTGLSFERSRYRYAQHGNDCMLMMDSVSYTHLTLPTIYSV